LAKTKWSEPKVLVKGLALMSVYTAKNPTLGCGVKARPVFRKFERGVFDMNLWRSLRITKDLACAVTLDVISMGGIWLVNGQSKTGETIEDLERERDELEWYQEYKKIYRRKKEGGEI